LDVFCEDLNLFGIGKNKRNGIGPILLAARPGMGPIAHGHSGSQKPHGLAGTWARSRRCVSHALTGGGAARGGTAGCGALHLQQRTPVWFHGHGQCKGEDTVGMAGLLCRVSTLGGSSAGRHGFLNG
jgi:hypothetical protein